MRLRLDLCRMNGTEMGDQHPIELIVISDFFILNSTL
jgi:hypothetical protein